MGEYNLTRMSKALVALALSVLVHGMLALVPRFIQRPLPAASTVLSFTVVRRPAPKPLLKQAKPPSPVRRSIVLPPSSKPPQEPSRTPQSGESEPVARAEPAASPSRRPEFGASKASVAGEASPGGVPVGDSVAVPSTPAPVMEHEQRTPAWASSTDQDRPRLLQRPRLVEEVRVQYPAKARRLGIEGTVRLRVLVGADGRVQRAHVLSGPGYGLNRAARRALLEFRFHPAIGGEDRQSIPFWITYRYTFRIDE